MFNVNLIICTICRNYFGDPRQISCGHSFCFDCISGFFDDETSVLTCPKCQKFYQYNSREEFESRCMRDGLLASMVAQFKKNQSRLSALSSEVQSRPTSSLSQMSISYGFKPISTPMRMRSGEMNSFYDPSYSECSTPSIISQQRSSSVLSQSTNRSVLAKCQSCNIKRELFVCNHCESVICAKCADEHHSLINSRIKNEWNQCQTKFQTLYEKSNRFETHFDECIHKARDLQTFINEEGDSLIQTITNYKNTYIDSIEKYRQTYKKFYMYEQLIKQHESIDKRIQYLLKSNDITDEKLNDFSLEIEHLESQLDNLNKSLDSNELKFPELTLPEKFDITLLLGTLNFIPCNACSSQYLNDYNDLQSEINFDDYVSNKKNMSNKLNTINQIPSLLSSSIIPKKKLLWQLDYKSVPYYIRTYHNQLFICDKYGYLSVYVFNGLNNFRQKPILIHELTLFDDHPKFSTKDNDQAIIDSFVISKLWIIVLRRKSTEFFGTIYLFTHDGKSIPDGTFLYNCSSRELNFDVNTDILWSLDHTQFSLFYCQLPDQIGSTMKSEHYFQHRNLHIQFPKSFVPKKISVNKNAIAVLDRTRQAVHVYDKKTRQQFYEYVSSYTNMTYFCWDMGLFSDNNLLLKFNETSSLKSGPSKHIYLHIDAKNQQRLIGTIEETDAYGMIITPSDEIFIGVRTNKTGIIKCYV